MKPGGSWSQSRAERPPEPSVCVQPFPLVSASRWLKKRGELSSCSEELSIWRAFSQRSYYLFLFNDVLIVTKKKRSGRHS